MATLTPLINVFTPDEIGLLANYGDSRTFGEGETVLTCGDRNDRLYMVLRGQLTASDENGRKLGSIAVGQSIGEMTIFDPGPASATVAADEETELWTISSEGLEQFHIDHPAVAFRLVTRICYSLSERLRSMNARMMG